MLNPNANPLLKQTEAAILAKVPPQGQGAFQRIMAAGLKVLDSQQSQKLVLSQLKAKANPTDIAGVGVAKLMGVLINQSKGTMLSQSIMRPMMLAASLLLCEALDRMEALGMLQITKQTLAAAQQSLSSALLQLLHVTPQRLDAVTKQGQPPQPAPPPQNAAGATPLIGAQRWA